MRRRGAILAAILLATLGLTACGAESEPGSAAQEPTGAAGWRRVAEGPLSPREGALSLWTGREVLVLGGSDGQPCPPNASCAIPEDPPLSDGAAYDPAKDTWRPIAAAPVPLGWAHGVVVGDRAYLWMPGTPGTPTPTPTFIAYRIDEDRWVPLTPPTTDAGSPYALVAAGDRIVAFSGSDEERERHDVVFDPATGGWSALPDDPYTPAFDRAMAWTGSELVLFDHELVPNPGAEAPTLTRAAALDLDTGAWRKLPTGETLATGPWTLDGGRLINPTLGAADGGETGNWGRDVPYGGIFDPAAAAWDVLPDPPGGRRTDQNQTTFAAGVVTAAGAAYTGDAGWVLDARAGTWTELPPLDGGDLVQGRSVVAAGRDLFVFGGARWDDSGHDATLLGRAARWSPPA